MGDTTNLVISALGVPPYSARGITQTLEPIDAASANLFRSINGKFLNWARPQFQLYKTTITGNDQNPPAIDNYWPGQSIQVDCVAELSYAEGASPGRTVVEDSAYSEAGFVIYRPRLTMNITKITTQKDEYGAITQWTIEAEEDIGS